MKYDEVYEVFLTEAAKVASTEMIEMALSLDGTSPMLKSIFGAELDKRTDRRKPAPVNPFQSISIPTFRGSLEVRTWPGGSHVDFLAAAGQRGEDRCAMVTLTREGVEKLNAVLGASEPKEKAASRTNRVQADDFARRLLSGEEREATTDISKSADMTMHNVCGLMGECVGFGALLDVPAFFIGVADSDNGEVGEASALISLAKARELRNLLNDYLRHWDAKIDAETARINQAH